MAKSLPVLDVRSPGEFTSGHIPGAISLPLFSNEQRAEIGIKYKEEGRQPAVIKGLELVGPRLPAMVQHAISLAQNQEILVHCWRGGMRSQSVAQVLELAELQPTVMQGGYKAFRAMARATFQNAYRLQVVSGLTGSGKTNVLHLLKSAGEQVIDLEGLAHHRGSAFGGIGQCPQPTTEQFENDLFVALDCLDVEKPVWIEDEGSRIGSVVVPNPLYHRIRQSPAVCIECSQQQRIDNLVQDYGDLPTEQLIFAIGKIRKRLDGLAAQNAITAVETGNIADAINLSLAYYDKTYRTAMRKMPRKQTVPLDISSLSDQAIVESLRNISQSEIETLS